MKGIEIDVAAAYVVLGPFVGGLLAGLDRVFTARLQGRVGPPLLQPFYDLRKLFTRRIAPVNLLQTPLIASHLVFAVLTGILFFYGSDILLIIFVLTLASIFLILAAYSTGSPYGTIGAERELLLMTAYEPMIIIALVALYGVAKSFNFYDILAAKMPAYLYLPGIYVGLVYVLAMKLRKSPFDISTSHHAHQELVMGLTADMGGPALAMVELAHWYETTYLYALVLLLFGSSWIAAVLGLGATFVLIVLLDNTTARLKWKLTLSIAWIVTLVAGAGNLIPFYLISRGTP
jgi:formate hydrogenlyase subunit 4